MHVDIYTANNDFTLNIVQLIINMNFHNAELENFLYRFERISPTITLSRVWNID